MSELLSQGYHWLEEILADQSKAKGVAPSLSQREAYILFSLLRFLSWPKISSLLLNIPCALEKNMYSAIARCSVM